MQYLGNWWGHPYHIKWAGCWKGKELPSLGTSKGIHSHASPSLGKGLGSIAKSTLPPLHSLPFLSLFSFFFFFFPALVSASCSGSLPPEDAFLDSWFSLSHRAQHTSAVKTFCWVNDFYWNLLKCLFSPLNATTLHWMQPNIHYLFLQVTVKLRKHSIGNCVNTPIVQGLEEPGSARYGRKGSMEGGIGASPSAVWPRNHGGSR